MEVTASYSDSESGERAFRETFVCLMRSENGTGLSLYVSGFSFYNFPNLFSFLPLGCALWGSALVRTGFGEREEDR